MTSETRVRNLRLRAPRDDLVVRGRTLIADALRTATVPGSAGRQLVVRHLALGRIDPGASPATVALQIEAALSLVAVHAVPFDASTAPSAGAVTFPDAVAPRLELLRQLARGETPSAWFWPLAIPGWHPTLSRDEAVRLALTAADHEEPAQTHRLAQLLDTLVRCGDAHTLLGYLRFSDGPTLLGQLGFAVDDAPIHPHQRSLVGEPAPTVRASWQALLDHWTVRWGERDARSLWLGVLAVVSASTPSELGQTLLRRAAALVAQSVRPRQAPAQSEATIGPKGERARFPLEADALPEIAPSVSASRSAATDSERGRPDEIGPDPAPGELTATDWAGLLFLIPSMARLRVPMQALGYENTSVEPLPLALLRLTAEQLAISESDGVREALTLSDEPRRDSLPLSIVAPWLRTIRRWLQRTSRLTLRELSARRGSIACSLTHVDLWLPMHAIDLRIRRNGLDIDPGWVGWLGRVVTFHYGTPP